MSRYLLSCGVALALTLSLIACGIEVGPDAGTGGGLKLGGGGGSTTSSVTASYSYQYSSDCDTGKQTFGSLPDLCAGLQNRELNNKGCAADLREQAFKERGCPGTFTEK